LTINDARIFLEQIVKIRESFISVGQKDAYLVTHHPPLQCRSGEAEELTEVVKRHADASVHILLAVHHPTIHRPRTK